MRKVGILAGSFDPITNGHMWLIKQAYDLVDELHIVVGVNPAKKYTFSLGERISLVHEVIYREMGEDVFDNIEVRPFEGLLVHYATDVKARYIIRGIRNIADFNYEQQIQQVNKRISSDIDTVFFVPPPEYMEVSSSTVKSLVGFDGWENIVGQYVNSCVVDALKGQK